MRKSLRESTVVAAAGGADSVYFRKRSNLERVAFFVEVEAGNALTAGAHILGHVFANRLDGIAARRAHELKWAPAGLFAAT